MSLGLNPKVEGSSSEPFPADVAAPVSEESPRGAAVAVAGAGSAAIVEANRELEARTRGGLSAALVVLCEQRDRALHAAGSIEERLARQRAEFVAEQDRFIAFLMSDHERQLAELEKKLSATKSELERRRVLTPIVPITSGGMDSALKAALVSAEQKLVALHAKLEAAYTEIDETRRDAIKLQGERDDAIQKIDDSRLESAAEVEAARGHARELEWKVDDLTRRLEDARDEAKEEALRMLEELNDARQKLDAASQEIWHLRARLSEVDTVVDTLPPPPGASELEAARYEVQLLRKQLIDAKREQGRLTDELEGGRTRRGPLMLVDDQEALTPRMSQIIRR